MKQFWQIIFFVMIVACAAIGGALIGQIFLGSQGGVRHHTSGDMHVLYHHDLNLNAQQDKELEVFEKDFRRQKALLEEQMKLANMEIAKAIKSGGYSSPEVQVVVEKIHETMGELQKLTLQHLANMQAVLSEEQNKTLEEKVVEQLYRNAGQ